MFSGLFDFRCVLRLLCQWLAAWPPVLGLAAGWLAGGGLAGSLGLAAGWLGWLLDGWLLAALWLAPDLGSRLGWAELMRMHPDSFKPLASFCFAFPVQAGQAGLFCFGNVLCYGFKAFRCVGLACVV